VILSTERKKKPRGVLVPTDVVLFHVLRVSAEALLRALVTSNSGAWNSHMPPPENERYSEYGSKPLSARLFRVLPAVTNSTPAIFLPCHSAMPSRSPRKKRLTAALYLLTQVNAAWLRTEARKPYRLGSEFITSPLHLVNGVRCGNRAARAKARKGSLGCCS
jgi:hypothetical protein